MRYLRRLSATLVLTMFAASGTAAAQPSDEQLLLEDFESGTLANWLVTVSGEGTAAVEPGIGTERSSGARLRVPSYGTGSLAYLRHSLAEPQHGISASGRFRVLAGGCAGDGTYSNGNVPFLRLFDGDGRRVAGLYRVNGKCGKAEKLYVQHSGNLYRVGKSISLKQQYEVELRISVSYPAQSLVQVYVDGRLFYETTTADNGLKPIASATIHNEHADQVGDLVADDVRIARFDSPPPSDPCDPSAPQPATADPGTTLLADNFETQGMPQWSTITRLGDASVSLQPEHVHAGRCAVLISVTANTGSRGNLSRTLPAGTGELWANGWFNVVRPGAGTTSNVPLIRLFTGGVRLVDVYRSNGDDRLFLRTPDGAGGFAYTSLGPMIAAGAWHELKLHAVAAGDASLVEVWLDGKSLASVTVPLGTSVLEEAMLGSEHFAQEGDVAADDVVLKVVA